MKPVEMTGLAAAFGAACAACGLVFERLATVMRARRDARTAEAIPIAVIAHAAATLAASIDDVMAPLRAEVRELRAEVHALRVLLETHGIPLPRGPFPGPPPP